MYSRTVRKYWPWGQDDNRGKEGSQRLGNFVGNHAAAIVACDFIGAVTAKFQLLYVFVILELGSRRIVRCNVTAQPTEEWTLLQFREGLSDKTPYRSVIHDHDCIFSTDFDQELVQGFDVKVLETPPQSPKRNALCKRLIGTIRECLDFMLPLNERRLRQLLSEWVRHYNAGRLHSSPGLGIAICSAARLEYALTLRLKKQGIASVGVFQRQPQTTKGTFLKRPYAPAPDRRARKWVSVGQEERARSVAVGQAFVRGDYLKAGFSLWRPWFL